MMMKKRREKNLNGGFRVSLVSVLPGEETSGVGAGGICREREVESNKLNPSRLHFIFLSFVF